MVKVRVQRTFSITEEENDKLEKVLNTGIKFADFIRAAIDTGYKRLLKEQEKK